MTISEKSPFPWPRTSWPCSCSPPSGAETAVRVGTPPSGCPQLLGPYGELPIRADEVTGVTSGVALQIILVLGLGFPEVAGRRDLGHDLPRPKTGGIDVGDRILSDALLVLARVEDRRAIACPDVIALAVPGGWIVNLEKEFQQPAVAYLRGVEDDFDRFGMCAVVAIRRVRHVAAGVANARRNHTILAANEILHSPEAAAGEHCAF